MSFVCIIFEIILASALCKFSAGDVFSSLVSLEKLIETQDAVVGILENYVQTEEAKLKLLKRQLENFKKHQRIATNTGQSYVYNPLNAYGLVKRLTADWGEVEKLIYTNFDKEIAINISKCRENFSFPDKQDLAGVAGGLIKLQKTYNLKIESLAQGKIKKAKYSPELTSSDFFFIGKQSYVLGNCDYVIAWMTEAKKRVEDKTLNTSETEELFEYFADCLFRKGDEQEALNITKELLKISPNYPRAQHIKKYYKFEEEDTIKEEPPIIEEDDIERNEVVLESQADTLCNGQIINKQSLVLKCRYITRNNPYLLIAPFKLEEVLLDPEIVIFHDVITDEEIEILKNLSQPKLDRTRIFDPVLNTVKVSEDRISKAAWLSTSKHQLIKTLTRRMQDMTDLSMETAETLQIANYGIGGFYALHHDFLEVQEKVENLMGPDGNRISTLLFYLSDVELGGATVFPHLNVTLWPKKGSAAYWYNLFSSGHFDIRTMHAACPVLIGSKWGTTIKCQTKLRDTLLTM